MPLVLSRLKGGEAMRRLEVRWRELWWMDKVSVACIVIAVVCTAINLGAILLGYKWPQ